MAQPLHTHIEPVELMPLFQYFVCQATVHSTRGFDSLNNGREVEYRDKRKPATQTHNERFWSVILCFKPGINPDRDVGTFHVKKNG